MNTKPLISIMIPVYNYEEYVGEAIESALEQTYDKIEVIVSDDCSTDDSWKVIQTYNDPRLKVFRNEENLGRAKNYQKILYELANGELAINLDPDDYYTDSTYLQDAVEKYFLQHENIVGVLARQTVRGRGRKEITQIPHSEGMKNGRTTFKRRMKGEFGYSHMAFLYKRKLAMKLNAYQQDITSADILLFNRMLIYGNLGYINRSVGIRREHDTNITENLTPSQCIKNAAAYTKPLDEALQKEVISKSQFCEFKKNKLNNYFFNWVLRMVRNREFKKAYEMYRYAASEKHLSLFQLLSSPRFYLSLFPLCYNQLRFVWLEFKDLTKRIQQGVKGKRQ